MGPILRRALAALAEVPPLPTLDDVDALAHAVEEHCLRAALEASAWEVAAASRRLGRAWGSVRRRLDRHPALSAELAQRQAERAARRGANGATRL